MVKRIKQSRPSEHRNTNAFLLKGDRNRLEFVELIAFKLYFDGQVGFQKMIVRAFCCQCKLGIKAAIWQAIK